MRAAQTTPGRDRLPWIFVTLAVGAWTIGMLVRSAFLIADVAIPTPGLDDIGHLTAAALLILGFIAILRGQRLAIYALILDSGAVVLLLPRRIARLSSPARLERVKPAPSSHRCSSLRGLWSSAGRGAVSLLGFANAQPFARSRSRCRCRIMPRVHAPPAVPLGQFSWHAAGSSWSLGWSRSAHRRAWIET